MAKIKPIASYRYDYDRKLQEERPFHQSAAGWWTFYLIILFLVILILRTDIVIIIFIAVGLAVLGNRFYFQKQIEFYPRFMKIGKLIIYYDNIVKVEENLDEGNIVICHRMGKKGKKFLILQEKFPTNARKDFKIAKNKRAKLEKTAARIKKHRLDIKLWKQQMMEQQPQGRA